MHHRVLQLLFLLTSLIEDGMNEFLYCLSHVGILTRRPKGSLSNSGLKMCVGSSVPVLF